MYDVAVIEVGCFAINIMKFPFHCSVSYPSKWWQLWDPKRNYLCRSTSACASSNIGGWFFEVWHRWCIPHGWLVGGEYSQ